MLEHNEISGLLVMMNVGGIRKSTIANKRVLNYEDTTYKLTTTEYGELLEIIERLSGTELISKLKGHIAYSNYITSTHEKYEFHIPKSVDDEFNLNVLYENVLPFNKVPSGYFSDE